jgi:hypothetical protein
MSATAAPRTSPLTAAHLGSPSASSSTDVSSPLTPRPFLTHRPSTLTAMSDHDDMTARHQATLEEFQAQGRELAGLLFDRAKAAAEAGDADTARSFAGAWHRITRSVRQSMALEALLKRQRERDAREDAERAELDTAVAEGKVRPHHRVGGRLVWHEAERARTWEEVLLERTAEEARVTARIAKDPEKHMAWLKARAEETANELEAARMAIARGETPRLSPLWRAYQEGAAMPPYGLYFPEDSS